MLSKAFLCFRRISVLRGSLHEDGPPRAGTAQKGLGMEESAAEAPREGLTISLGQGLPNANGQTHHLGYPLKMQMAPEILESVLALPARSHLRLLAEGWEHSQGSKDLDWLGSDPSGACSWR